MTRPDRDKDWGTRVASLAQKKVKDRRSELQGLKRAALSATQITGDEHWDFFLSVVNERMESSQKAVAVVSEALKNSDDFSPETLINQKLAVRLLGREIEVLQWVTELPKELMEQGDSADQLLGIVDESSD